MRIIATRISSGGTTASTAPCRPERRLAIEQDLDWYTDTKTGKIWSVVAHGDPISGHEPTMEHYFFDRVRPIVERALKEGQSRRLAAHHSQSRLQNQRARAPVALSGRSLRSIRTGSPPRRRPPTLPRFSRSPFAPFSYLPASRMRSRPSSTMRSPSVAACSSSALRTPTRETPWRFPRCLNLRPHRIIAAGGTIPGASWKKADKQHAGEWTTADDERLRRW